MEKRIITKANEKVLQKMWGKYTNLILNEYGIVFKKLTFESFLKNVEGFLKNKYFLNKYKKAPSDLCKFYIAIIFCRSFDEFNSKSNKASKLVVECIKLEGYLEYHLKIKDFIYLRDHIANMVQAKMMFNDIIKAKRALKKGEKLIIKPHVREIYNPDYDVKYKVRKKI